MRANGTRPRFATYLNQHPGNGHYLVLTTISLLTSHITGASKVTYTDMTPLAQIGTESVATIVRADSRFNSGKELAEAFKANPSGVTVAFANALGNQNHRDTKKLMDIQYAELSKLLAELGLAK